LIYRQLIFLLGVLLDWLEYLFIANLDLLSHQEFI
jgi:hypothetical protein